MKPATITLGVLLAVSLLANALSLLHLASPEPAPKASPRSADPSPAASPATIASNDPADNETMESLVREVRLLRNDIAELKKSAGNSGPDRSGGDRPSPPLPRDPKVAEALVEQQKLNAMMGELRTIAKTRDQLAPGDYFRAIVTTTADALGLVEPARSHFMEVSTTISTDMERLWADYQEKKKAITVDPANAKATWPQVQALNKQFDEQVAAEAALLKQQLNPNDPQQSQFASKSATTWILSYLAPEGAKNYERRGGGRFMGDR